MSKYWYVAKELGEDAKPEQVLKVMEAVGGLALKLALEKKEKEGPFGFNKKVNEDGAKRLMVQMMHHQEQLQSKLMMNGQHMNLGTDTKKPTLQTSLGGTVEKNIPENVEWIDDAFYVKETRFGLYVSILKIPLERTFSQVQLKMVLLK